MFRRVRFECAACSAGFVDWHDEGWERVPVFCVNCGEPIEAGTTIDDVESAPLPATREVASALGIVKGSGEAYPDTLRGLRVARPSSASDSTDPNCVTSLDSLPLSEPSLAIAARASESSATAIPPASEPSFPGLPPASEPSRPLSEPSSPGARPVNEPRFARATSTAPKALHAERNPVESTRRAPRAKLAPIGTFLLGFAAGVPLTLCTESLWWRPSEPQARPVDALEAQLAAVASALDDGAWDRARRLLGGPRVPQSDRRAAALRARLTLGLISVKRRDDARRELSALAQQSHVQPPPSDLERLFDAQFGPRPSTSSAVPLTAGSVATASAVAAPAPRTLPPSRQSLLATARDSQRRSRLEEAERLYRRVLQTRPNDSEAHAGLAEVQLLRGSASEAQALFERALRSNDAYVPAWIGLADIDWLAGQAARAACRYQLVVNRFPEQTYPPYIVQRLASVLGSGVAPPEADPQVPAPDACER